MVILRQKSKGQPYSQGTESPFFPLESLPVIRRLKKIYLTCTMHT